MSETRLEHVAIAVSDLESALRRFRSILARPESGDEVVESEGVRVAFFDLGGARLELMEPVGEDSPIARFLERRGPGLHHLAVEVPDIESAIARCREAGLETVGEAPRDGAGGRRVAFLHPRSASGVLIELSQPGG